MPIDASLILFREWVIDGALRVKIDCQFHPVSDSSLAFHNLTCGENFDIITGQWLKTRWTVAIEDNHVHFANVLCMEGTGQCRATVLIVPNVFEVV